MELAACKKYIDCGINTCQISVLYRQIFPNCCRSKYRSTRINLPIFSNNILEFPIPSTSSPCKKRYSICLEYNIKEKEPVGLQQPLFSLDYCSVGRRRSSFDRRRKQTYKKMSKKRKQNKNSCLFWNNNLCRGEKGDTSPPSMKKKTKAGTTTSIPVHLVGGNWIKSSCPEVKIVPLHVFVDLNQRLLAIQLFLPWAVFYSCNPRCQSLLRRY